VSKFTDLRPGDRVAYERRCVKRVGTVLAVDMTRARVLWDGLKIYRGSRASTVDASKLRKIREDQAWLD
jgi:hypothetical protein